MVIEQCKHTLTNGLICVDCGIKVLEVETRPCKDCAHHKRLSDGSICKKHLMAVVPDMLVTFYVDKGTCFEVFAPSEEVKTKKDLFHDKVEIPAWTLIEIQRAFKVLKDDKESYLHKVFNDDHVFDAINIWNKIYNDYFNETGGFLK